MRGSTVLLPCRSPPSWAASPRCSWSAGTWRTSCSCDPRRYCHNSRRWAHVASSCASANFTRSKRSWTREDLRFRDRNTRTEGPREERKERNSRPTRKTVSSRREEILTRRRTIIRHCHREGIGTDALLITHFTPYMPKCYSSTKRPPTWPSDYIESQPTVAAVAAFPHQFAYGRAPRDVTAILIADSRDSARPIDAARQPRASSLVPTTTSRNRGTHGEPDPLFQVGSFRANLHNPINRSARPEGVCGRIDGDGGGIFVSTAGSVQIAIRGTFRMCAEVRRNWFESMLEDGGKFEARSIARREVRASKRPCSKSPTSLLFFLSPWEILSIARPCYSRVRQTCAIIRYQRHTKQHDEQQWLTNDADCQIFF